MAARMRTSQEQESLCMLQLGREEVLTAAERLNATDMDRKKVLYGLDQIQKT